jgi:hypothetical protein
MHIKSSYTAAIKQSGFSILLVILSIALVAGLGIASWAIWDNSKSDSENKTSSTKSVTEPKSNTTPPEKQVYARITPPEGWNQYKSPKYSFSFSYPAEWGEPSSDDTDSFTFSKDKGVVVRFNSKDTPKKPIEFGNRIDNVRSIDLIDESPVVTYANDGDSPTLKLMKDQLIQKDGDGHLCAKNTVTFDSFDDNGSVKLYVYEGYCSAANKNGVITFATQPINAKSEAELKPIAAILDKVLGTFTF